MDQLPKIIYGTAWKEHKTDALVKLAVKSGFRAIDTANQPKHYSESLVGNALIELAQEGITRDQLYLQTKFTPINSQDERVPYEADAHYDIQVQQSFLSSLQHLHTTYIDSYLLHGPYSRTELTDADWAVWTALEALQVSGKTKTIGISNVTVRQLKLLTEHAKIKPKIVQNRCFAVTQWDRHVREYCQQHDIIYQGFSLLTANQHILLSDIVKDISARLAKTPMHIILRFAMQIGIIPLTGTSDPTHMQQDLALEQFSLSSDEVSAIESIQGSF